MQVILFHPLNAKYLHQLQTLSNYIIALTSSEDRILEAYPNAAKIS